MSEIKKGLVGVIVDETAVSKVNPETNSLIYRGYPVQDLAGNCSFEEVAYLLWHSELPNANQLEEFKKSESNNRVISDDVLHVIKCRKPHAHPMDVLRSAVSVMSLEEEEVWDKDISEIQRKAIRLLAAIPTCIAADMRTFQGKSIVSPRSDLSLTENFLNMCFGEVPDAEVVSAFEASLILYAEHSFNASTFSARVIASTTSDIYSAVCGGIGALKGPLHGGANEQVMYMMKEVGSADKAEAWLLQALKEKRKIMGFGHRVYRNGDSRVPTMKKCAERISKFYGETKWMEMYEVLDKVMLREKNIHPNLDFPAGPAYYMMGFPIEYFTPIFVLARITGWSAHIIEQGKDNKIIRPLSSYVGMDQRSVTPLSQR